MTLISPAPPRLSRAEIEIDLAWLGVVPDLTLRQSDRGALYEAAADRLRAMGRLYPCYETAEELERRRKMQQARGAPPIYDRAALHASPEARARWEAEGRRPHWRFMLEHKSVAWRDLIRGEAHIDCASLSDPVLIREDGSFLYTLPSVVDDIELAITHIIRGEDHVTNTAVQLQLFAALAPRAGAAGLRASQSLDLRLGRRALEAHRLLVDRLAARGGLRGAGGRGAGDADRLLGSRAGRALAARTRGAFRSFPRLAQSGALRPRRSRDLDPPHAGGVSHSRMCATGWPRMTSWASRRSLSGSPCAAI